MPIALPPFERDITVDAADRRDQHWVPVAYLRQWRDPNTPQGAYILVCPKDRTTPPRPRSAKRIFTSPDMNTMIKAGTRNLWLESIYHAMETSFGTVRAKIISGLQATDEDIHAVVHFVAAQMVRTPKFRSYWRPVGEDDRGAHLSAIDDPAIRTALSDTIQNIDLNHQQILSLLAFPKALQLLAGMRVRLFKAPDPRTFITSDAPCCVIDYEDTVQSLFESMSGSTVNVLMPLSPDVIVLFDKSEEPHEMTQIFPDHPFIEYANAAIWAGAVRTVVLPGQVVQEGWLKMRPSKCGQAYVVM
jgi:hypothetical protein